MPCGIDYMQINNDLQFVMKNVNAACRFEPLKASEIRLNILECVGTPQLMEFSAWMAEENLFSVPLNPVLRSNLFITTDKDGYVKNRNGCFWSRPEFMESGKCQFGQSF